MAATVSSSVWGAKSKPGAWALDAEEHDEELRLSLQSAVAASVHPEPPSSDFPTLASAAATKTKKKKPQTLSLSEFSTYSAPKSADSQRLTTNELINLPTGPRERTAEELERSRGGFGSGFRSYGYDSANPRARVSERGNRDRSGDDGISRADEDDDWSKAKKHVGGNGAGGDRRERVGFFNSSRADEVDNWASNKSYTPSEGRMGRRMGSDSFSSSGGADSDNWGRKKEERDGSVTGGGQRFERERRGLGFESSVAADSENWLQKKEVNPVAAVDGGRPKLNLQPRTLPVSNGDGSQEVKPKTSNPFGDARPRELVLKEKGQDWKEIDEKLDALKVKEVDGASGAWKKGSGNVKDDSTEKKTWRKWGPASPASADKVENGGDAEKAKEVADEKTENGDAENN